MTKCTTALHGGVCHHTSNAQKWVLFNYIDDEEKVDGSFSPDALLVVLAPP